MRTISDCDAIRKAVAELKRSGKRIGFVPTMGALHEGHLSLVRTAKSRTDAVLVSIFVNPTQFGPNEDFSQYPRCLQSDLELLDGKGVAIVFAPEARTIYPENCEAFIEVGSVSQPLEGERRPGHFRGVATVVAKLFHLTGADVACFGEKDYQQLAVIRSMVADLNFPVEIVSCPTVREHDGLAMSSRNRYLTPQERKDALVLHRALKRAEEMVVRERIRRCKLIREDMEKIILSVESAKIDYISLADAVSLREHDMLPDGLSRVVALLAVRIGATRLIDNTLIEIPVER